MQALADGMWRKKTGGKLVNIHFQVNLKGRLSMVTDRLLLKTNQEAIFSVLNRPKSAFNKCAICKLARIENLSSVKNGI